MRPLVDKQARTATGMLGGVSRALHWEDYDSGGNRYVEVSDYTVRFNRLDPTWAITNGLLRMTAFGRCGRGCTGTLGLITNKNYTPPSVGTLYTYTPSWHGQYILVDDAGTGYHCANSVLTYKRGTATYTFSHGNVCQGASP